MWRKWILPALLIGLLGGAAALEGRDDANRAPRGADSPEKATGPDGPASPGAMGDAFGGRRHRRPERLTEQQQAELLAAMQKHYPEAAKHLAELKKRNPRRYRVALAMLWRRHQQLQAMPAEQREVIVKEKRLRVTIARLQRALEAATESAERERLGKQLAKTVGELFDVEQTRFRQRLARLEAHVKRLREELSDRQQRRDEIIAERVEALLDGQRLGPGGPGGQRGDGRDDRPRGRPGVGSSPSRP